MSTRKPLDVASEPQSSLSISRPTTNTSVPSNPPSTTTSASKRSHHLPSLYAHRDKRHDHLATASSHGRRSLEQTRSARDTITSAVAAHAPSSLHDLVRGSANSSFERAHSRSRSHDHRPGATSSTNAASSSTRHHHHHHHHHHHRRPHHTRHKSHAGDTPNATAAAPAGPTTDPNTGIASAPLSRRPSQTERTPLILPPFKAPPLAQLQAADARRLADLHAASATASALTLDTMRGLDDTHYALLERFGALAQHVATLRDAVAAEAALDAGFAADAGELERETGAQMEGLAALAARGADRVAELQGRLRGARARAEQLGLRLESAARKVDERERVERVWEAKVARRLRVLWGVCVAVLAVLVVGGLTGWLRPGEGEEGAGGLARGQNGSTIEAGGGAAELGGFETRGEDREEDPRLRLLDEL